MIWIPIVTLLLSLIGWIILGRLWLRAWLLYGNLFGGAIWLMAICWLQSLRRFGILIVLLCLGGGVGPYVKGCLSNAEGYLLAACLASIALSIAMWNLLPPAVLFLAASGADSESLRAGLKAFLRQGGYRIVYLLRGSGMIAQISNIEPHAFDYESDNLRTRNDDIWQHVLHRLIALVPVVVLDGRPTSEASDAIIHECDHILKSSARLKTIFLSLGLLGESEVGRRLLKSRADMSNITIVWPSELPTAVVAQLKSQSDATLANGRPLHCQILQDEQDPIPRPPSLSLGFWIHAVLALVTGFIAAMLLTITVVVSNPKVDMNSPRGLNVLILQPGSHPEPVREFLAFCGGSLAGISVCFVIFSVASFKGYGASVGSLEDLGVWLEERAAESERDRRR